MWLSVWSKVQMICIWSSWCHCHPITSCFSKIWNGFPFWWQLTQVVLEKRPLNACSSSVYHTIRMRPLNACSSSVYHTIRMCTTTSGANGKLFYCMDLCTLNYIITSTIALIIGRFLSNSTKFHGDVEILWQWVDSIAWLEIPWPAENCGS